MSTAPFHMQENERLVNESLPHLLHLNEQALFEAAQPITDLGDESVRWDSAFRLALLRELRLRSLLPGGPCSVSELPLDAIRAAGRRAYEATMWSADLQTLVLWLHEEGLVGWTGSSDNWAQRVDDRAERTIEASALRAALQGRSVLDFRTNKGTWLQFERAVAHAHLLLDNGDLIAFDATDRVCGYEHSVDATWVSARYDVAGDIDIVREEEADLPLALTWLRNRAITEVLVGDEGAWQVAIFAGDRGIEVVAEPEGALTWRPSPARDMSKVPR